MIYSAPSQPQQVFLGFTHDVYKSKPVYGPSVADFDSLGNLYIRRSDGSKEWIGPHRDGAGKIVKNPNQMAEEDCCYTIFGYGYYDV